MTIEELRKFQARITEEMGEHRDLFKDWFKNAESEEIEATCFFGWALRNVLEDE